MSRIKYSTGKYSWKVLLELLSGTLARNERRFKLIQKLDREIQRSSNDPDRVFEIIFEEGLREVSADFGHIIVKTGSELVVKYSSQKEVVGIKVPIKESLCGSVLESMKMECIENVVGKKEHRYFKIHQQTKSELAIPIRDSRDIKVFGILNLEWKRKTSLSEEDISFVELLNGQLAIAMEQIKLWQGVRMVSELSSKLVENAKTREEVYDLILGQILNILDFDLGQILLVDKGNLVIVASSNPSDLNVVLDAENSICGHYIFIEKQVEPLTINDLSTSAYQGKYQWILGREKENIMGSEFVVPLIGRENNTIGVINIEDPRINAFSEFDEFIIGIFGKMIASTIEASNVQKIIRNMQSAEAFDYIFASLGHQSISFLHNFGGDVGNAKARLAEFKRSVSDRNHTLPTFSGMSAVEFLDGIIGDFKNIELLMTQFREKLNPENINKQEKRLNLIEAILAALSRADEKLQKKKITNIKIEYRKDISVEKRRSIDSILTEQFNEILDLLVNNAMEAMPNGGRIEISLKLTGLFTAQIYILDNGTGMDQDTLDKVFDFGFTTKTDPSRRKGEGIGLWLSKIYFQRFGAQLYAESDLGKGTSFYISNIPIIISDVLN